MLGSGEGGDYLDDATHTGHWKAGADQDNFATAFWLEIGGTIQTPCRYQDWLVDNWNSTNLCREWPAGVNV